MSNPSLFAKERHTGAGVSPWDKEKMKLLRDFLILWGVISFITTCFAYLIHYNVAQHCNFFRVFLRIYSFEFLWKN